MKLDFKRKDAIAPALEVVGRVGVPSSSLIFNADVVALSGEPAPDFSIEDLLPVREAHPTAVLSLGAKMRFWNGDPGDLYTSSALDGFKAAADRLGGPVTFALRVDKVLRQPEVVEALSDVAKRRNITLWNDRSVLPYTKLDLDVLRRIVRNGFFDFDETVV